MGISKFSLKPVRKSGSSLQLARSVPPIRAICFAGRPHALSVCHVPCARRHPGRLNENKPLPSWSFHSGRGDTQGRPSPHGSHAVIRRQRVLGNTLVFTLSQVLA